MTQKPAATKASPVPVEVANEEPLAVEVVAPEVPKPVVDQEGKLTLPPTTTAETDRMTAGQRATSMLWEFTQATIAVSVTLAMIYTAIMQIESLVLTSAFFLITGTYFARTNSHRVGGVGPKANESQPYLGR